MSNTDPVLKRLNLVRILYIAVIGLILIAFIIILIASTFGYEKSSLPLSNHIINLGVVVGSMVLSFTSISLIAYYYKKAQQQRIIAVQGGIPGPVATEQPIASSASLTLPLMLRFHANWRYFLFFLILPMVLIILVGSVFVYFFMFRTTPHMTVRFATIFFVFFGGFLLFFLIVMGVGLWFAARRLQQYVEVTEEGIRGRFYGQETDLRWDEVKLFALWGGKSKVLYAYEVAGERGVVRWTAPVKNRWYNPIVSTLPFEEYYPQMQDVLALISAKTDLPLRDLRLKWYGSEQKQKQEQQQVSNVG